MPAPTPKPEDYILGATSTFTVAGYSTANISGGVTVTTETDDMTNNGSVTNGRPWRENVQTVQSINANVVAAYKQGNPPLFVNGNLYPCVLFNSTPNAPSFYGNFRIKETGIPDYFNVKGGVKLNLAIESYGYISSSNSSNVDPV